MISRLQHCMSASAGDARWRHVTHAAPAHSRVLHRTEERIEAARLASDVVAAHGIIRHEIRCQLEKPASPFVRGRLRGSQGLGGRVPRINHCCSGSAGIEMNGDRLIRTRISRRLSLDLGASRAIPGSVAICSNPGSSPKHADGCGIDCGEVSARTACPLSVEDCGAA